MGNVKKDQVWEACMAASHYKLDNLCAVLDYNHLQIDGNIDDVISPEPFASKFESFGWNVLDVNGHDFYELRNAFNQAKNEKGNPTMIIAHTIKGKVYPSWKITMHGMVRLQMMNNMKRQ